METQINVLLVDDETRFCETTSKLLIKKGFHTTLANSAENAILILKENPQDVIILDLKMAGMDGHGALNKIKETTPETQVIILTGHGSKYSATRALVRDAFDYLAKPCDINILASRIHDAYQARHHGYKIDAKTALDIMTPIDEETTVRADISIKKALALWFPPMDNRQFQSGPVKPTPDSVLVSHGQGTIRGILTKMDIIRAVRPEYLAATDSSTQESFRFSSIFWNGFFSDRVNAIAEKKVSDIMSERPPVISENANLLEVAHRMWQESERVLLVQDISRIIGIIRDQNIFGEILSTMTNPNQGDLE